MRTTPAHVIAKANNVNALLGYETLADTHCRLAGAVRLYNVSSSTYMVVRNSNEHGGISQLSESGTLREAGKFLDGMRAALQMSGPTLTLAEVRNGTGFMPGQRFRTV